MKTASLPRWLARLFTFLFYGQLIGYVLAAGIIGYVAAFGLPESGAIHVVASINGVVTAPNAPPETKQALQDWSKSTFDLKLGLPGSLSRNRSVPSLSLDLSLNGPSDFAKLPALLLLSVSSSLLLIMLILFVSYQFMKLFSNLADRRIFDQPQVDRLMYIGYSLLSYAGLSILIGYLVERGAVIYLERFGYSIRENHVYSFGTGFGSTTAEAMSVLIGLCVLALAQVFKYGMELKQENELTV